MCDFLVGEVVDGIGSSGIRCGLIGEVGCSYPLTDNEKRSLEAAVKAQQRTGEDCVARNKILKFAVYNIYTFGNLLYTCILYRYKYTVNFQILFHSHYTV